ncbi:MAG: radical SAM protein [Anaerostipes sp.]|jgi:radical SAM protein with 4Fe4S-binding SPASM domain|nr:radical SAM protein [Anaerostipes sp.]
MDSMDISKNTLEERLFRHAEEHGVPLYGILELLPLCNLNCKMCYVRLSEAEMKKQGRLRTVDEWLQIAREMKREGTLFLLLTGGEPLLYPGFQELYLELRKLGMIVTINTNGTLLNDEWAEFFGKNKPRRVNITLYGSKDETYEKLCGISHGFQRTLKGIKLLQQQKVDIKINGSLVKENQKDYQRMIEIGEELDIPVRIDTYMYPAVRERECSFPYQSRLNPETGAELRVDILEREMGEDIFKTYVNTTLQTIEQTPDVEEKRKGMTCRAGKSSFVVNWKGEMTPCVVMGQPKVSISDVGFKKAWDRISKETQQVILHDDCYKCKYRKVCNNCAASAMAEEGSYHSKPEYICKYTKKTIELLKEKKRQLKRIIQIGEFTFEINYNEEIQIPEHLLEFETKNVGPQYKYTILLSDDLPEAKGVLVANREDIRIFNHHGLESRFIGVKGREKPYAYYEEISKEEARITVITEKRKSLTIDPIFMSLFALEKRILDRKGLILHCAYINYQGKAILFSAPSGVGKSTQASLWEKYQNAQTINGDRALLQQSAETWMAKGWPVCGTSGICENKNTPIQAIVMVGRGEENQIQKLKQAEAIQRLYTQVTVNSWDISMVDQTLNLLEEITRQVPVYYLACDISKQAVECLKKELRG